MTWQIICGDVRDKLPTLGEKSVHCCVTSPPYWGLRDYGHPDQLGLEKTPEEYVENLVDVFEGVRHVLRDDGTLWLVLGDSYARTGTAPPRPDHSGSTLQGTRGHQDASRAAAAKAHRQNVPVGLKQKDLVGIPWRVAFALQAAGWYLRADIIWSKPNPMPESITDRPTKVHEYVFLLAKFQRYYFDQDAVREPDVAGHGSGTKERIENKQPTGRSAFGSRVPWEGVGQGRNIRSVWTITTQPFPDAHFAVFPPGLVEPCIKAGCPSGGTVLDPFSGAGTTGMVATRLGRSYIGIELNEKYAEMSRQRIDADAPLFNRGAQHAEEEAT